MSVLKITELDKMLFPQLCCAGLAGVIVFGVLYMSHYPRNAQEKSTVLNVAPSQLETKAQVQLQDTNKDGKPDLMNYNGKTYRLEEK